MVRKQVRLTCPLDCPDACSLLVTVEGQDEASLRAVKVDGDPRHPVTRGFACVKTYRYPERAYHPQRPSYPMRRVGPKGSGQWERVSWDEALDDITARLQGVIAAHGPESILPYHYAGTMGLVEGSHVNAFFRAIGAIELDETICATAGSAGWEGTYGSPRYGTDPEDVPQAKLVILWGINSLSTNSHLTPFITEARKRGARVVHVDPYESRTSRFADEHVRVRVGTDAALALAMANVIISNGLADRAFVERAASGFEDFRRAAAEWPLERAAEFTGVPAEAIERLALEYGRTTPSFIRLGYGMTRNESGANGLRAVAILPVLTGQWQHRGGGAAITTSGGFRLNRARLGAAHVARPGVRHVNMNQLASALEPDAGVHGMFVYNSNPAVVAPDSGRVRVGMLREDLFTVVLEQAMTETADLADYVLPATTFIEHDDLYTAYGHYYLSWNRAATPPYGEARPNTFVFQQLARRLGVSEPSVYWSAEEVARDLLASGHPWLEGVTFERLENEGFVRLNLPQPFLPYANGSEHTSDGRLHLSPPPRQIEFQDRLTGEYPLRMITPPAHHFLNTTYGHLDSLTGAEGGEPTAMVHPDDAARNQLQDGQLVTISSAQGSVVRRVRVTEQASKGTVVVEGTWWGTRAPDRRGINHLTSERLTDLGGGSTFHNTPVRLEPVAAAVPEPVLAGAADD